MVKYKKGSRNSGVKHVVFRGKLYLVFEGPPTGSNWITHAKTKGALFYQVDEHSLFVIVH